MSSERPDGHQLLRRSRSRDKVEVRADPVQPDGWHRRRGPKSRVGHTTWRCRMCIATFEAGQGTCIHRENRAGWRCFPRFVCKLLSLADASKTPYCDTPAGLVRVESLVSPLSC